MKILKLFTLSGLLFGIIFINATNTFAQICDLHMEIEGGISYNLLYWHVHSYVINTGNSSIGVPAGSGNRTHFRLSPAVRIGFIVPIAFHGSVSVEPFVGYHLSGGQSKEEANSYQDRMSFRALAPGVFLNYHLFGYRLSIGARYDIYETRYSYYHGTLLSTNNNNASWEKSSINFYIKNHSWDAGFRIGHPVWRSINLEASAWYGLSNLATQTLRELHATIRPVQFRLMLSYRL